MLRGWPRSAEEPGLERRFGDTDPDGALYLACAIATDAAVWSDDPDFDEQDLVDRYSTNDVIAAWREHREALVDSFA